MIETQITLAIFALTICWLLWSDRKLIKRHAVRIGKCLAAYRSWRVLKLFRDHYLALLLPFGFIAIVWGFAAYLHQIPGLLGVILQALRTDALADNADDVRSYAYAFAAMAGSLALLLTIPFQLVRVWINERTTRSTEQGLITDRINKAVEGLGAEKTVKSTEPRKLTTKKPAQYAAALSSIPFREAEEIETGWASITTEKTVPNIEVRIGAIYSLERIAQDSERDHIQIMEILCAYIRENAPTRDAQPNPLPDWPEYPENPTAEDLRAHDAELGKHRERLQNWVAKLRRDHKPRADIQTALSVLGRRNRTRIDGIEFKKYRGNDRYRLDLRHCNLQAADLAHLDFRFARIEETQLLGADLTSAKLQKASLTGAGLMGADLKEAKLQGTNLTLAELQGANLTGAELQGAGLLWAGLQGASLIKAKLEWTDLSTVELQGADLTSAKLQGAVLKLTDLQGTVLTRAKLLGAVFIQTGLQGADLSGANLQGAYFIGADLRSVVWAGLRIDSVPTPFTDLRSGFDLTQDHLSSMIGNAATLLPDDPDLFLPDRWASEPPHWATLVQSAKRWLRTENDLRREYLCAPGQTPQKTGTPWPIDRDPPWVEQGIDVHEWVKNQPTRGPVDPTDAP